MNTTTFHIPPIVRVFSGRSESFVQSGPGSAWQRLTNEDEARRATGHNRETKVPSVGVYVIRTNGGRVKVGFDLWRLSANLTPAALARLENRWRSDDAPLFSRPPFARSIARCISRKAS
jgi:hypothetical protein